MLTLLFHFLEDLLATPELSLASPWLNTAESQPHYAISDEAYECIPGQLLGRVRADSLGTLLDPGPPAVMKFTGLDGWDYALERSSNLATWTRIAINQAGPAGLLFSDPAPSAGPRSFYRSVLLP